MTRGSIYPQLIKFSFPLLIGQICQLMYSAVDTLVCGRYVGVNALAALGATGSFCFLIIGFGQGLAQGFSVILAQRYGAKDADGVRKTFAMTNVCCAVTIIIVSVMSVLATRSLLEMIGTPLDIIDDSEAYLEILFGGLVGVIFYNQFSAILRAVGDSIGPLIFLIVAAVINIILDFVFVLVFHWDVRGVGYATVIAQVISALSCFIYIMQKFPSLRLRKEDWKLDFSVCGSLFRLGLPSALMNSVCAVGCIIVQRAVNSFGTTFVAAFVLGNKIEGFMMSPYVVLGNTAAIFIGQNYGAGNYRRIKDGTRALCVIGLVFAVILTVMGFTCARPFSLFFVDSANASEEVIEGSVMLLHIISLSWIPLYILFIFRAGSQGLGSASIPIWTSVAELSGRIIVAYSLPALLGEAGIILSDNIAWTFGGVIALTLFLIRLKKVKPYLEGTNEITISEN